MTLPGVRVSLKCWEMESREAGLKRPGGDGRGIVDGDRSGKGRMAKDKRETRERKGKGDRRNNVKGMGDVLSSLGQQV